MVSCDSLDNISRSEVAINIISFTPKLAGLDSKFCGLST